MSKEILCKLCHSSFTREYILREMMFGTQDTFLYYECSGCGCLQIAEIPLNIDKYYPPYYYSFNATTPRLKNDNAGTRAIREIFIGKKERKSRKQAATYLAPIQIKKHHKILDVGCGRGELICRLFNMGYKYVEGTDKYLPDPINFDFNVKVMKRDLREIESNVYDLVMMHHVLEHMFNPEEELIECYRILKRGSFLMIRIPVKNYAWEKYQKDWVQLDPPRHFFIHTCKSVELMAGRIGFKMHSKIFDSTAFQFEGSELYKANIPLHDRETHEPNHIRRLLTKKETKSFAQEAEILNQKELGDQAIFYLYKE